MRGSRWSRRWILALVLAGAPGLALGEMYRCVAPDGRVTFTDDASACPGARKHESPARVQTLSRDPAETETAPAAPRADRSSETERALADEQAQRKVWEQKKRAAEAELRSAEERRMRLERVVAGCNRGAEIITRDSTGLKYRVSCDEVRREHAAAESQAKQLREYLDGGLRRECRQAGCLPGWIR